MIDDSEEDRALYARYLRRDEDHGYTLLEAASAAEAHDAFERYSDVLDCVLLDLTLPDGDGTDLLGLITGPESPCPSAVIVLTGTGSEAAAVRSMRGGAQDYLVKSDLTPSLLQNSVDQAIERFSLRNDLKLSEERARLVLNNLPVMVFALDENGQFIFADGSGMAPLRLTQELVIGRSAFEIFESEPYVVEQIRRTLTGEQTTWSMTAHERYFEAYCTARPGGNAGGAGAGIYGIILDVTLRKQAEALLERSRKRIEAILGGITDAYICLDRDWRIVDMNAPAEQTLFRRPKHELVGELAWTDYPDVATAVWYSRYEQALRDGHDAHFEARSALNGRWYEAHVYPDEEGLAIYLTDITERKKAESELSQLYLRERRIAETLQRSLLSSAASSSESDNLEFDTVYKSARDEAQVGGDFYDIFQIKGDKMALVLGDVSGKGLDAASRTAEVKYTLRAYLREYPGAAVAMRRLNHYLNQAAETDATFRGSFVCVSLVVLDLLTGECESVMAGAEPPAIIRAGGEITLLRMEGLPLACDDNAEYDTIRATLEPGDLLMMTTDGLTEARQGKQFLGLDGVAAITRASRNAGTLQEIGQTVLRSAEEFSGGQLQDDTCLLLARRKEPARAALAL